MAHYDGSIKFDTSIDSRNFESGVQKLKSTAIKGMAVVGTAFTAAAGYAINLASDLQEVQNVVDVTFGDKAADIETWAKNAAGSFGLSELQAKKFNGTMGAMIKSMGLTDSAVYEMSTTLTGLAADFASFYNLEHQEAFDKIRAGISGETEPLKQLGINMSVANLEAYALSQGITKSYNAMSQAEQATLRYNYLLQAGADAQGDFARTSDSFANQLKIAKLNVTELASEFGEVLLPIALSGLKMFNGLFDKLNNPIRENKKEISEAIEIYKDFKEQKASVTNQLLVEIDAVSTLVDELNRLSDESGNVADCDKARAKFILDELNKALGTEYTMTGNIINQYDTLKTSVYDLIAAKQYEILMNEASAGYEKALKGEADAIAKLVEARKNYANASQEEKESAKANLDEAEKHYQQLLTDRMTYEEAARLATEKGTQAAVSFLEEQRQAYASSEYGIENYASSTEKALATAGNAYQISLEKLAGALEEYNNTGSESARALINNCISEVEKAKGVFVAAGGTLGSSLMTGIDGTEIDVRTLADKISIQLNEAMKNGFVIEPNFYIGILNSAQIAAPILERFGIVGKESSVIFGNALSSNLEPIKTGSLQLATTGTNTVANEWVPSALNPIGMNFSTGLADGINSGKVAVKNAAAGLANLAITTPKNILIIRSPSRRIRDEVGKMIPLGMAAGIKENSDKVVEAFEEMLEVLDYQRKFDIVNEEQYYTELERLRDKYFAVGTDEWLEYTEKIYSYQKEQLDKEKELYKKTYDDIFEYTSDKIDAVIEKQEAYSKKLKAYGSLFNKVTIKLDEGNIEYYKLSDLKKDTEALRQYNELMASAKAKVLESGISESAADSFLSELHTFDIDEGTSMLRAMLSANNNELGEYLKAYEEKQAYAESSAASMYSEEMDAALDESIKRMREKLTEAGFEIPETFFDAGKDAAVKFGDAFASEMDVELNKIKEKIEGFKTKIKVDVEVSYDKATGATVYKYYGNNSYYLGNSGETTQERLEAVRRDEEFRRMSGEGD